MSKSSLAVFTFVKKKLIHALTV